MFISRFVAIMNSIDYLWIRKGHNLQDIIT